MISNIFVLFFVVNKRGVRGVEGAAVAAVAGGAQVGSLTFRTSSAFCWSLASLSGLTTGILMKNCRVKRTYFSLLPTQVLELG